MSDAEIDAVVDILTAHDARAQNMDGDWLCACGAFLCPPGDDRLYHSYMQHVATIIARRTRVLPPEGGRA